MGRSAFAHKGGVHVSAVLKDSRTYEHMDPTLVGNQRRILVSELSGTSTIVAKAKELGIDTEKEGDKAILDKLKDLESEGFQFEAAEASFELLMQAPARAEPALFPPGWLPHLRGRIGEHHALRGERQGGGPQRSGGAHRRPTAMAR